MALEVWAVDADRIRRGQLEPLECTAVLRDTDTGTYQIQVPDDDLAARIREGWRVIIQDEQHTILSGPLTSIEPDLADESVTLTGVSDLVHLADRLVYPDPTRPEEAQTTTAYYKRTAAASNVIDHMIHHNAGSAALADRRVSGLTLVAAAGGNLGGTVVANLRFKNLLEEARALARLGGVTFDAAQEGDRIVLRFRVPADRSRAVRFSPQNDGATAGTYRLEGPSATTAVVAGQGEGTARTIIGRSRASVWGRRIEVFKDQRDTDDLEELEQSAREELDGGAEGAAASFTVQETEGLVFGVDYLLGDTVAVEFGAVTIAAPVRMVELSWDGHGRTAALKLGDHDQADDKTPAWVKHVKRLDARMRGLETT